MEKLEFLVNNDTNYLMHLSKRAFLIIDLPLKNSQLGFLLIWKIVEEYPSLFDH